MISQHDPMAGGKDLGNLFEVKSRDGGKSIEFRTVPAGLFKNVPVPAMDVTLDRPLALNLAAWLVTMAGGDRRDFEDLLHAIRKS